MERNLEKKQFRPNGFLCGPSFSHLLKSLLGHQGADVDVESQIERLKQLVTDSTEDADQIVDAINRVSYRELVDLDMNGCQGIRSAQDKILGNRV